MEDDKQRAENDREFIRILGAGDIMAYDVVCIKGGPVDICCINGFTILKPESSLVLSQSILSNSVLMKAFIADHKCAGLRNRNVPGNYGFHDHCAWKNIYPGDALK